MMPTFRPWAYMQAYLHAMPLTVAVFVVAFLVLMARIILSSGADFSANGLDDLNPAKLFFLVLYFVLFYCEYRLLMGLDRIEDWMQKKRQTLCPHPILP